MLMNYDECLKKYKTDYQIKKKLKDGELYKIEKGIYSTEEYVPELSIIAAKYPNAVITMDMAFYMHGLTDVIPDKYCLSTDKDSSKINDKRIKQRFEQQHYMYVGVVEKEYQGSRVKVYSEERMLIEVIRNKSKLPFDYYKEIICNYRERIHKLDVQTIQEYACTFPKSRMITEILMNEVF